MGNRAIITTPERKVGLYLHWNGGRDTVEPLLKYCDLQNYRSPSSDNYGWARLCQVLGNFFGGSQCVGIDRYTTDEAMNPGDNGIYIIEGWKIVDRIYPWENFEEQNGHPFNEMLQTFDKAMPESEQLGKGYLNSKEVPTDTLNEGDKVYVTPYAGKPQLFTVVGFDSSDICHPEPQPYVNMLSQDDDYSKNPNNYIRSKTCRIPA